MKQKSTTAGKCILLFKDIRTKIDALSTVVGDQSRFVEIETWLERNARRMSTEDLEVVLEALSQQLRQVKARHNNVVIQRYPSVTDRPDSLGVLLDREEHLGSGLSERRCCRGSRRFRCGA